MKQSLKVFKNLNFLLDLYRGLVCEFKVGISHVKIWLVNKNAQRSQRVMVCLPF